MTKLKRYFITTTVIFSMLYALHAHALIHIVAAENIYGEVAQELGGPQVEVISILNNPAQDPHLFSNTPSTAKAITNADIVIYNGADYDPWMDSILLSSENTNRKVINVANLVNIKPGANPHIWYLPTTMPIVAKTIVALLTELDPTHKNDFDMQLLKFNTAYESIFAIIKSIKRYSQNLPVIATEPVFTYMANSLDMQMHGEAFQTSIMNDVPPSIAEVKAFEDDLTNHKVKLLIYNDQVINPMTKHMQRLAEKENIPVLGVSEMLPPKATYINWIMRELIKLQSILQHTQRKI